LVAVGAAGAAEVAGITGGGSLFPQAINRLDISTGTSKFLLNMVVPRFVGKPAS
jgi:hypothetical protein